MEVQLRNDDGATWEVGSVKEAFEAANEDDTIWKISWAEGDHRIRLVRPHTLNGDGNINWDGGWLYEPIEIPNE